MIDSICEPIQNALNALSSKNMLMIRGIIIAHLLAFCFAANAPKRISFKTGNKLAVLTFESYGISDPITEYLTEEFNSEFKAYSI